MSGYWQLEMDEGSKEKTAFSAGSGLWQFRVMPFGLCNAPATFERLMEQVLAGLPLSVCLIYLDDILVPGRNFEEELYNLQQVFEGCNLLDKDSQILPICFISVQRSPNHLRGPVRSTGSFSTSSVFSLRPRSSTTPLQMISSYWIQTPAIRQLVQFSHKHITVK